MALNIYHEARGEPFLGWLSVAFVTINRVYSPKYPDSVCEVVWQDWQFEWTQDGRSDTPRDRGMYERIQVFTNGLAHSYKYIEDPTEGADHYHAKRIKPYWVKTMKPTYSVGSHLFYKQVP